MLANSAARQARDHPLPYFREACLVAANKSQKSSDPRRAPRERAFLKARLSFANGTMSFPCLVTQISATGARLAVDDDAALPDHFQIAIAQKGVDRAAKLIWRRDGQAAVEFAPVGDEDPSSLEAALARLRVLEAENISLRATVAKLTGQLKQTTEGY